MPRSLMLYGVDLREKDARARGGYAEVFQAFYGGKLVALKRLRLLPSAEDEEKKEKKKEVSSFEGLRDSS